MILVKFIDFLRDRLGLVIKACLGLLAALVVLDIVIALTSHHEVAAEAGKEEKAHGFMQSLYHIAHSTPVFWSVFGFIACVLIVYISKWYGHLKIGNTEIMTREDYYNE